MQFISTINILKMLCNQDESRDLQTQRRKLGDPLQLVPKSEQRKASIVVEFN